MEQGSESDVFEQQNVFIIKQEGLRDRESFIHD